MRTLTSKLRSIEYLMTLASERTPKVTIRGFRHTTPRHRNHKTKSLNASKHLKNDVLKSKTCLNISGLRVGLSIFECKARHMKQRLTGAQNSTKCSKTWICGAHGILCSAQGYWNSSAMHQSACATHLASRLALFWVKIMFGFKILVCFDPNWILRYKPSGDIIFKHNGMIITWDLS